MTKLLHQIFYGNKKFDFTPATLKAAILPFALTTDKYTQLVEEATASMSKYLSTTPITHASIDGACVTNVSPSKGIPVPVVMPIRPKKNIIVPESANTLFWSIFIGHHGYTEYMQIGSKYLNREMDEKQAIVKSLAATPKRMKQSNYKITNVAIQEIMAEMSILQHDKFMNGVAYASFYEKTILLVFDHSYMVFRPTCDDSSSFDTENTIVVVQQPENARRKRMYGVVPEVTDEVIAGVVNTKIRLENYTKPMKGMSTYTISDLESMICKIPSLEVQWREKTGKWKKSELYELVVNVLAVPYQT